MNRIVQFIQSHEKIVICGAGEEAKALMLQIECRLNKEDIGKLEFYDKKAVHINYNFAGKKVMGLKELVERCKDYYMLIATSRFRKEIFCSLVENMVDPQHITVISDWI